MRSQKTIPWLDVLKYVPQVQKKIDQAERHDRRTIDQVLGDQDMDEGGDVFVEADRDVDLLEQILFLGHPESEKERLASWLRLPRRARVAIRRLHPNYATSTERITRADATCCPSSTRLYECCKDLSMPGMRQHEAETSNTQSVTTSTLYVQSRSES